MAQGHGILKAITYRLTTTPIDQLPSVASQISGSIWNCKDLLSASADSLGSKNDAANLVHRFKTRIGSLLQDRTIEGRWAGVVLCKAAIEAGGAEILSKSGAWTRSLIAILKKNDPPTTRCLTVVTLTRIFTLTWGNTNLVREITTPVLPGFVATCLSNVEKARCTQRELQYVLEAYATLLPKHPTIFRSKEVQIQGLAVKVLCGGPGIVAATNHATQQHKELAQRLLTLLHYCAPKQGGSEAWDGSFQAAIGAAHATCERLFRSVFEDWVSTTGILKVTDTSISSSAEARLDFVDRMGFPGWQGVLAGQERLITLLDLLKSHLQSPTTATVPIRLGSLIDLLSRVLIFTVPSRSDSTKTNPEVSKDEREALFVLLPAIHVSALDIISVLLDGFGHASVPFVQSLTELVIEVYRAESFDENVRTASYRCLQRSMHMFGLCIPKQTVQDLIPLMRGCCNDLLSTTASDIHTNGTTGQLKTANKSMASDDVSNNRSRVPSHSDELTQSASSLLPTLIGFLNSAYIPRKLRTQIERTAVLTRNKEALLACVMHPSRKDVGGTMQTSLLPVLAREFPDALEVEALLRPRMPPIKVLVPGEDTEDEDEVEVDDIDDDIYNSGNVIDTAHGLLSGDFDGAQSTGLEEDELYSTNPPPQSALKRPADVDTEPSTAAKRPRAYPIVDAAPLGLQSDTTGTAAVSDVPVTTIFDGQEGEKERPVVVRAAANPDGPNAESSSNAESSRSQSLAIAMVSDDDGSDFEIPPLTMEESDEEEEDEED